MMKSNSGAESRENRDAGGAAESGNLFIISAPSGAGKSTLCNELLNAFGNISYSVSFTTRKPREGERNGVEYHFITREEFRERIDAGRWLEWAEVHGNYYGTSLDLLTEKLSEGENILLDIDVQGAAQILKKFPDSVTIFIMPPSMEVLEERLLKRGQDSREVIEKRLVNARDEIARKHLYRHVLVNDDLAVARKELFDLVRGYVTV